MLSLLGDFFVQFVDTCSLSSTLLDFIHANLWNQVDPYRVTLEFIIDLNVLVWLELRFLLIVLEKDFAIWRAQLKQGIHHILLFQLALFFDFCKSEALVIVEQREDRSLVNVDLYNVFLGEVIRLYLKVSVTEEPVKLSAAELFGVELLENLLNLAHYRRNFAFWDILIRPVTAGQDFY